MSGSWGNVHGDDDRWADLYADAERSVSTTAQPAVTPDAGSGTLAAASPTRPLESLGLLVLRVVLGLGVAAHGSQKLFGWFGGDGLDGTASFFADSGFAPGEVTAWVGGLSEFVGGLLIVLGLLTSAGGAAVTAVLLGAVGVKWAGSDGAYFASEMGIELELLIAAAALALVLIGPGRFSLDHGRVWNRPVVRAILAVIGVAAGIVALVMALQ
ncbi:MAG TPA: DoxX family protein [Jiangellaceae bacterium]|nr:DoxX family protein [Jiangellaceae bacterium]